VVHATQVIALETAKREGRKTVDATILESDEGSVLFSIDDDRLVEDEPLMQFAWFEFVIPTRDIPAVSDKHAQSSIQLFPHEPCGKLA
jgi:hypothetical protein